MSSSAVEKLFPEKFEDIWSPNVSNVCMTVLQLFISTEPHVLINSHELVSRSIIAGKLNKMYWSSMIMNKIHLVNFTL